MTRGRFAEAPNRHLLLRVPANASLKPVRHLADGSYLAEVRPPRELKREGCRPITVRVIECTLDDPNRQVGHGEKHRLLTDLLDADKFPAVDLVVIYHERWEVEIGNDELKTHQLARNVHLRSKTPAGVIQEVYGVLLAFNAIRYHMYKAAAEVGMDPRRISFTHTVRVLREAIPLMKIVPRSLGPLLNRLLLAHIRQEILPPRDNRSNPRVVKKKMSNFAKKRPEHSHVPQPQKSFRGSVVILN